MPTTSTNFGLLKPLVNNATDADLWGGYLNTTIDDIDGLLLTAMNWTPSSKSATFSVTSPTPGSTATGSSNIIYVCNATGGAFSANLPAVAGCSGMVIGFKKIDASVNAVTITANGAETIDGSNTYSLNGQFSFLILACDGDEWNIVSSTPPSIQAASTTVAGILKTATAAIALAGTDATAALTAQSVASNSSIAATGYYKLPGGLILQWGSFTTGGSSGTVTFPIAFPTAVFQVFGTCRSSGTIFICDVDTSSPPTTTHATFRTWAFSAGASATVNWFAIGN